MFEPGRFEVKACIEAWMSLVRAQAVKEDAPFQEFRHARSGFEVVIAGHSVDGYGVDANGRKHVYQFHGWVKNHSPALRVSMMRRWGVWSTRG